MEARRIYELLWQLERWLREIVYLEQRRYCPRQANPPLLSVALTVTPLIFPLAEALHGHAPRRHHPAHPQARDDHPLPTPRAEILTYG